MAHGIRTRSAVPLSLEPSTTTLKKAIWKVKAPRKLKHFLWQATSGFLATATQLKQRHCTQDSSCPRCGADEETINHTLFLCPPALQCWALSTVPSPPGIFPCQSLYENINDLLHRAKERGVDPTRLEAFPWTAWYIWKARNEKTFNGKGIAPDDTVQFAQKEAESWKLAQIITEITETQTEDRPVQAMTLQNSTIQKWRCQVDASWKSTTEATGLGFVLLKDDAPTLFGVKGDIKTSSPLHAEAEGMLWAMQELLTAGWREVHLESDCEQLVKLVHLEEEWPALAAELDEIKALCNDFLSCSISFIPRSENVRADHLAKGARSREINSDFVSGLAPSWLAIEAGLTEA